MNVSLINKKFRDVSRDSRLWTKLILDIKDIKQKQSEKSCRKLIDRCKKLTSLEITNNSLDLRSLNLMSDSTTVDSLASDDPNLEFLHLLGKDYPRQGPPKSERSSR